MTAIAHFESLTRILKELGEDGIELYEHHYHPLTFGIFELELGRGHERLKFTWDGRDSTLSISFATFPNKCAKAQWTHDANISLPNREGLYAEIDSQSTDMLVI